MNQREEHSTHSAEPLSQRSIAPLTTSHIGSPAQSKLLQFLLKLPRYSKRVILMSLDFFLLCLALWFAYSLRLGVLYWPQGLSLWLLLASAPVIGVLVFHYNGLYKVITRFYGNRVTLKVGISMGTAVLIWCLLIYMSQFTLSFVPRSVIVMYGLFSALFVWTARSFISYYLRSLLPFGQNKSADDARPVIIYGVGEVGNQLAQELAHSPLYRLIGFIDENPSTWRQLLFGVRVYAPDQIPHLVKTYNVKEVFLVAQDMTRKSKRKLVNDLAPFSVQLKALSAMHELASDGVVVSDLRQIGLADLLGRKAVPPDQALLDKTVRGKSVMITGAGGSIGSELARQVVRLKPANLVIYERSELALYQIDHELKKIILDLKARGDLDEAHEFDLIGVLGSVQDESLMAKTISYHKIDTIYHAAAYKHVPIVEDNPFSGLENNVFGSLAAAKIANEHGVGLFVLISTDKAVRPTNVMGASKRIAELCLQAYAGEADTKTIFTMVRFGNVLGSSGSVVGRFQEQIEKGGPVTVTHPEITRFFMSIPEAAQLVIQAGGLARGGDVFVLDMGLPVKIVDLAKSMINLSGLEVADEENPDGDIAIEFIGLRDGEKLFEELLINENSSPTDHPSITRNNEGFLPMGELMEQLQNLQKSMDQFDRQAVVGLLSRLVEGYQNGSHAKADTHSKVEASKRAVVSEVTDGQDNKSIQSLPPLSP